MFCRFFCDRIIGFDVTQNLVGGNLQLKPRMIHPCTSVSPRKCGVLWKLRRGTAVRGLSWGFVRGDALESCDPELSWRTDSDGCPRRLPLWVSPGKAREEQQSGGVPARSQSRAFPPFNVSFKAARFRVVLIAPEFSSGWQFPQSKHGALCRFLFCCLEWLNVSCSVLSLPH